MKKLLIAMLALTSVVHAESITHGSTTINMDFVNIGYAGNVADTADGNVFTAGIQNYGAVGYDYRIGMLEVTIDQFAKARAADSRVSNGNEGYWNSGNGINYNSPKVGLNAPASYVTAYEAMKFANWLTTGDAYSGAYQFSGSGALTAVDRDAAVASYGTVYVLPSEDEWYKAAYYKPVNDGSYSLYANGSDNAATVTHGTANGWNYVNNGYVNGWPNYTWGTGYGAEEQNGTFDMMGNEFEWMESAKDGTLDNMAEDRVVRGGSAYAIGVNLSSSNPGSYYPSFESQAVGFRVAAIPEPASAAMIAMIGGCGWFVRRRFMI